MLVSISGRAIGAVPSPDGAWLLDFEQDPAGPGGAPGPFRLMRHPTGGGPAQKLLDEPYDNFVGLNCPRAPGAACVLSRRGHGKEMVFFALDPVRGQGERITQIELEHAINGGDVAADWSVSPDGSRLAVVDAQPRIKVFSRPDRLWREIRIDPVWGVLNTLAWAADGNGFFAVSRRPGFGNLVYISPSGKVHPLLGKVLTHTILNVFASSDGKHLAWTMEPWESNAWMMENF
jgi:hypothetical protein